MRGIRIDQCNNLGFTALMKAAIQGRTKVAKLILFAGTPFILTLPLFCIFSSSHYHPFVSYSFLHYHPFIIQPLIANPTHCHSHTLPSLYIAIINTHCHSHIAIPTHCHHRTHCHHPHTLPSPRYHHPHILPSPHIASIPTLPSTPIIADRSSSLRPWII